MNKWQKFIVIFVGLLIVGIMIISTVHNVWIRKPTVEETSPKAIGTQGNILPNQKRIEEIVAEVKRRSSENEAANKKSAEEKTNQQIRISILQKTVGCTGKKWEIHNCIHLFERLSTHPDIVASIQELAKGGLKIRIETSKHDDDPDFSFRIREDIIYLSADNTLVIETETKIKKIREFFGLPVTAEKTENRRGGLTIYEY